MRVGPTFVKIGKAVLYPVAELEAWDFSVKHPGAIRYRSLPPLLEKYCTDSCWNLDYWSATHEFT